MKKSILATLIMLFVTFCVSAADGVQNVRSQFSVKKTADRMERILREKGMTIFNRIKHSESAGEVGIELRETELIIFGNPKAGSPLMKCQQSIALDLPQKVLIWQDENNKVWLSYNDPRYLKKRHHVANCEKVISKIGNVLADITKTASDPD